MVADNLSLQALIEELNEAVDSVPQSSDTKYVSPSFIKDIKHRAIGHINIRSIDSNGPKLQDLLYEMNSNIHFLTISEFWKNNNNFLLDGYQKPAFTLRPGLQQGGGVAIYVKNGIPFQKLDTFCYIKNSIEVCTISTRIKGREIIIACIYRPPNHTQDYVNTFISELNALIDNINSYKPNCNLEIVGDYNIDLGSPSPRLTALTNLIDNKGLDPAINIPTRITRNTATILDYFLSNSNDPFNPYIVPVSISDHFLIIKSFEFERERKVKIDCRKYSEENVDSFKNRLINEDWNDLILQENHDLKWEMFLTKTDEIFNNTFPKKTITVSNKIADKPWYSDEILIDMNTEKKLYVKSKATRRQQHIDSHKEFKRNLDTRIRNAKKQYFAELIEENKHNPKNTWKILNKLIGREQGNDMNIEKIIVNGNTISDDNQIANSFNEFFASIGHQLESAIPANNAEYQEYINEYHHSTMNVETFSFSAVTLREVIDIGKTIQPKSSCGPDEIPSKIIKIMIMTVPGVFQSLINSSLNTGKVHQRLKDANVIAIHKKASRTERNNFRPISLINSVSKIVEKIVGHQLREHLDLHGLFYESQFGFRKLHSTTHAMLCFLEKINRLKACRRHVRSIFVDLTKAFDTVKHSILLDKLKAFGVRNIELEWFRNYLLNRRQRCRINNCLSEWIQINIGVPQGSILGPLLFAIFINDLPNFIRKHDNISGCVISLFADDTEITVSHTDPAQLTNYANEIITLAQKWFRINKLTLNPGKTRTILFTKSPSITPSIDGIQIKEVYSTNQIDEDKMFKFLGFQLDEKLDFKSHTEQVIKKLNSANYIIRRIKNQLGTQQKINIYNAIFRSQFEYGISIWCNEVNIKRIEKLQKRAIFAVDGPSNKRHSEPIFKKLGLLDVKDIKSLNDIGLAHGVIHNYSPILVTRSLQKKVINPIVNLRSNANTLDLEESQANSRSITKWIIPNLWNQLGQEDKEVDKIKKLKLKLKKRYLDRYTNNPICGIQNCFVCGQ